MQVICHILPKPHEFSQFQTFFLRSFFFVPNASFDNERAVKIPNGRLLTGPELRGSCDSLELTNMESLNSMLVSTKWYGVFGQYSCELVVEIARSNRERVPSGSAW